MDHTLEMSGHIAFLNATSTVVQASHTLEISGQMASGNTTGTGVQASQTLEVSAVKYLLFNGFLYVVRTT